MTSNGLSGEWRSEELGSRGQHAHACVQETHEQVALSSGHDGCVDAAARPEAWSWLDFAAV